MFCPNCASPVEPSANFCKQCGVPVKAAIQQQQPSDGKAPRKKGCCSCSGCLLIVSFLFFVFLLFLAYAFYSGPEFLNKFLAPSEDNIKEMAMLPVTKDDADTLEKNMLEFQKYIQKGGTVEIHLKEIELNSYISRRLLASKNQRNDALKDLKVKLSEDGIKFMGILKIVKLESYFTAVVKIIVDDNKKPIYELSGIKIGKIWVPAFVFNIVFKFMKNYIPARMRFDNFTPGVDFQINKIAYTDSRIIIECYKSVP